MYLYISIWTVVRSWIYVDPFFIGQSLLPLFYIIFVFTLQHCGSYFTAVLYIEHWCEERFNGLQLGYPDFSHLESVSYHYFHIYVSLLLLNLLWLVSDWFCHYGFSRLHMWICLWLHLDILMSQTVYMALSKQTR